MEKADTPKQANIVDGLVSRTDSNGAEPLIPHEIYRLTSVTTPLGYRTDFAYSAGSDILEESDSLGRVTRYEYDVLHNLVKATDPEGGVTTYEYDALNRPTAVHLPDGISTYKKYNARNQVEELTTSCDDCGWILGHYLYTYDDRGYLIAEHTEEAREKDPYGRQPHTPYKPEKQGKNCDHGSNRTLSYYLLVQDKTYTCVKHRCS